MKKRIVSMLLAAIMVASLLPMVIFSASAEDTPYMTDAGTGARSATDADGNVYLGGNYIEIGLSKHGSFGTIPSTTSVPKNFHTYWFLENSPYAVSDHGNSLGMIADGDGWNKGNDPVAGDFFVPGSPYEGWSFCYRIDLDDDGVCETTRNLSVADLSGRFTPGDWNVEPVTSLVNTGDADTVAARTTGTTLDGVVITLDYSFGVDGLFYTTEVNIQNNSGKKIVDVFYCRDFDPDQDEWFSGDYVTYNKTLCNPDTSKDGGIDNFAMVVSRGCHTGAGFFFLSLDNRATAVDAIWGLNGCYSDNFESIISANQTPYTKYDADRDSNDVTELSALGFIYNDNGIGLLCDFDTIENGASDKFVYFSSLDPDVTRCVNKVICAHTDANKDHICDLCNETITEHDDTDKDHLCDICSQTLSTHSGTLVNGVAATNQNPGYKNYYKCDCGKFFEDETCTIEITDLDAWKAQGGNGYIAKLEEEPKPPQTGDTINMTLWMMLMALSSMGLCACLVLGKKRKNEQ